MKLSNLNPLKMPFLVKGLLIITLALGVTACNDDDPQPSPAEKTVVDIAVENGFNKLAEALTEAGLVNALNGTGPFTVFAPTDAAFDALYADLGVTGPAQVDDATLSSVLQYHVFAGNVTSDQLSNGEISMLNGKFAEIDATVPSINDANIVAPLDLEASNGVVHTIDAVIVPEMNIVEIASGDENLTILYEALSLYPDLVELLSDESGTFTVFAPSDAAFEALLPVIKQESLASIPENVLKNILQYHVIAGAEVLSTDLAAGEVAAANGENITITENGGTFQIAGQDINQADIDASNGVIHKMAGVLVPPSVVPFVGNVLTFAYFNKDFTTLVAAVSASNPSLVPALQGDNITLFAPTNAAFEAAGITEIPSEPTLSAVLTYHVLGSIVKAGDIPATDPGTPYVATSLGGNLYISNQGDGAGVFINGTTGVTGFDLTADNGAVVHVIDRTLLPPTQNVVELAVSYNPNEFTQLVAALTRTTVDDGGLNLIDFLSGDGPFTVFAPTDAAFQALLDSNPDWSSVDDIPIATLRAVLTHHVGGFTAFSTDLASGPVPTFNGNITVDLTAGTITDGSGTNTANLTDILNVHGTNGVIHVIDQVLLP